MPPRVASSPVADHVVGRFPRAELSAALAATHRAGFGPQTRVFDSARGDIRRQLERAGLRSVENEAPPVDAVLIVVTAPGRTAIVADLFARLGAESVTFAARRGLEKSAADIPPALASDIRIADDAAASSEV